MEVSPQDSGLQAPSARPFLKKPLSQSGLRFMHCSASSRAFPDFFSCSRAAERLLQDTQLLSVCREQSVSSSVSCAGDWLHLYSTAFSGSSFIPLVYIAAALSQLPFLYSSFPRSLKLMAVLTYDLWAYEGQRVLRYFPMSQVFVSIVTPSDERSQIPHVVGSSLSTQVLQCRCTLCRVVAVLMRTSFGVCHSLGQYTVSGIDPWLATARWREMGGTFLHLACSFPHALIQFLDKLSRHACLLWEHLLYVVTARLVSVESSCRSPR